MTDSGSNSEKMEQLKSQAKEAFEDLKHRAHGTYEKASQTYQETFNRVRATSFADVKTTLLNYVKDHPIRVASTLLGTGVLIGAFISWKRRK